MTEAGYVVAIKPSARRGNAAAGRYVHEHGSRRAFDSRAAADEWAEALSADGRRVWVRDANPNDAADVDGYLIGRVRRRHSEAELPGDQADLDDVAGTERIVEEQ